MKADIRGRVPTKLPGYAWVGRRRQPVIVRNISACGAMIEIAAPMEEGAHIRLDCSATGDVDAKIVWVVGDRCGLLFDRALVPRFGNLDEDAA